MLGLVTKSAHVAALNEAHAQRLLASARYNFAIGCYALAQSDANEGKALALQLEGAGELVYELENMRRRANVAQYLNKAVN